MISKIIILLALVAAPALSSSVKGYADTKGLGRVEQEPAKLAEETKQFAVDEQQTNERLESVDLTNGQQQEEQVRRTDEELKAPATQARYEARPQVIREEQVKRAEGSKPPKYEPRPVEEAKAPISQVRYETKAAQQAREEQAPISQVRYETKAAQQAREEQAPIAQSRYYARSQATPPDSQQLESQESIEATKWTNEEQRRLVGEQPPLVQPIAPLSLLEETHREQIQQQQLQTAGTKGAAQASAQAPFVEAEPYAFSYQVDGSSRSESGDSRGIVRGQYTLQGADGANRIVDYIADANGFRATVNTNEFGTEARSPANVVLRSSQPLAQDITLRAEGKTREDLLAPQAASKTAPAKADNWAVKGPALAQQAPIAQAAILVEEVKGPKKAVELATKGQKFERIEQSSAQYQQQQQQQQELKEELQTKANEQLSSSAKSAELRTPKEIKTVPAQHRDYTRTAASSGFESANAHRVYHSQPAYAPAPAAALRQQAKLQASPASPASRGPRPVSVTRAHLQRDRYPPRRTYEQESNPRVSFYGSSSSSSEEDLPFEQPEN